MVIMGMTGFTVSGLLYGIGLTAGINGWLSPVWALAHPRLALPPRTLVL